MRKIIRIAIKGSMGYGSVYEDYNDKLTIDSNSITYEYIPRIESETNPVRRWSYKTTSKTYQKRFDQLVSCLPGAIDEVSEEAFCPDVGRIDFIISYDDGTREKKEFWLPGSHFQKPFSILKKMIPPCEDVPYVLG